MFYPNTINSTEPQESKLLIVDELAGNQKIQIKSQQLPIINFDIFNKDYKNQSNLKLDFVNTKASLITTIKNSLRDLV